MQQVCPQCYVSVGAPDFVAKAHIWWANQHGRKERIFCDHCGAWTDVVFNHGKRISVNVVPGHEAVIPF